MTVQDARRLFPHTWTEMAYLNHAAVSPISFRVRDAVDQYLTRRSLKGIEPYPWALKIAAETRSLLADLMGARSEDVAFVLNTSDGLNILASGLDWQPGDEIVLGAIEFPANQYPFVNLERLGVKVVRVEAKDYRLTAQMLIGAVTERTKLVTVSAVQFLSGELIDLQTLGAFCRSRDILFAVDAIQALPHTPINVQRDNIDFLASGSHKWLMSPEGTGFVYAGERLLSRLTQTYLGWTSVDDAFDFRLHPERLRAGAGRFENGTLNYVGIAGLNASLKMFGEFGVSNLRERALFLTELLIDRLRVHGFQVITPQEPSARSGIVTFEVSNPQEVYERLLKSEVVISIREGKLRVSPHFYNTEEDIGKLIKALV